DEMHRQPTPPRVPAAALYRRCSAAASSKPKPARTIHQMTEIASLTPAAGGHQHGHNRVPFSLQRALVRGPARLPVAVVGVALIALRAMQVGMHPGRLARMLVHDGTVRLVPV